VEWELALVDTTHHLDIVRCERVPVGAVQHVPLPAGTVCLLTKKPEMEYVAGKRCIAVKFPASC